MTHRDILMQELEEREQAARELSQPPCDYLAPRVVVHTSRHWQDIVMAHWFSEWLMSYWIEHSERGYIGDDINAGPVR